MKNLVLSILCIPFCFVGMVEAGFNFYKVNHAFDQLVEQVNRVVSDEFFSYQFNSAASGSEIAFDTDISMSEDSEFVHLKVVLGKEFNANNVTAEQRGGTIIISMQEEYLMGRLEIDEWKASFGLSEYKKKKNKKDKEGQTFRTTAFRSLHTVSLPARINLTGDPIVEIQGKTLLVQLPKYVQKVIEVKKGNGKGRNLLQRHTEIAEKKDAGLEEALRAK